ncbi:MAG: aminoacyl-tRNA hydrolase [bacterium]|nr:aminoacyl-tRNA hydrolase [bacterium]
MKIIVGLGNIGEKYLRNRHNIGFLVLDQFTEDLEKEGKIVKWKEDSKMKALTAKVDDFLLAKPTTLMNLSGEAISKILSFYKEKPENLLVIQDDIDLPLGKIRVRDKGSAGTHNGMKSVIRELGTQEFKRIKVGIESRGELSPEQQDLHNFVLSDFNKEEYEDIYKAIKESVIEIRNFISS